MDDLPLEKHSTEYDGCFRTLFLVRCQQCSAPKYVPRHKVARSKFCSRKCGGEARGPVQRKNELTPIVCTFCGETALRLPASRKSSRRFCGPVCIERQRAKTKARRLTKSSDCLHCDIPFKGRDSRFCSFSCQHAFNDREILMAWKMGFDSGTTGAGLHVSVTPRVRRYIWAKYGHKCARCGWANNHPVTGHPPLTIDHIDGNPMNSCEDNLILLCPCCHSLTPTYGALNKGRGRGSLASGTGRT